MRYSQWLTEVWPRLISTCIKYWQIKPANARPWQPGDGQPTDIVGPEAASLPTSSILEAVTTSWPMACGSTRVNLIDSE